MYGVGFDVVTDNADEQFMRPVRPMKWREGQPLYVVVHYGEVHYESTAPLSGGSLLVAD